MRHLFAALGFAVLLAGCDTDDPERIGAPTPLDENALVYVATQTEVTLARADWLAQGPDDYVFEYYRLGGLENQNRYRVRVQNRRAVEAVLDRFGEPVDVYEPVPVTQVPHATLDALYAEALDGFDQGADSVSVGYLPSDGLPGRVVIDRSLGSADDETILIVLGFDAE